MFPVQPLSYKLNKDLYTNFKSNSDKLQYVPSQEQPKENNVNKKQTGTYKIVAIAAFTAAIAGALFHRSSNLLQKVQREIKHVPEQNKKLSNEIQALSDESGKLQKDTNNELSVDEINKSIRTCQEMAKSEKLFKLYNIDPAAKISCVQDLQGNKKFAIQDMYRLFIPTSGSIDPGKLYIKVPNGIVSKQSKIKGLYGEYIPHFNYFSEVENLLKRGIAKEDIPEIVKRNDIYNFLSENINLLPYLRLDKNSKLMHNLKILDNGSIESFAYIQKADGTVIAPSRYYSQELCLYKPIKSNKPLSEKIIEINGCKYEHVAGYSQGESKIYRRDKDCKLETFNKIEVNPDKMKVLFCYLYHLERVPDICENLVKDIFIV